MRLKKKVKVILVLAIILIIAGLAFLAYESFKPKATKTATVENEIEEYLKTEYISYTKIEENEEIELLKSRINTIEKILYILGMAQVEVVHDFLKKRIDSSKE